MDKLSADLRPFRAVRVLFDERAGTTVFEFQGKQSEPIQTESIEVLLSGLRRFLIKESQKPVLVGNISAVRRHENDELWLSLAVGDWLAELDLAATAILMRDLKQEVIFAPWKKYQTQQWLEKPAPREEQISIYLRHAKNALNKTIKAYSRLWLTYQWLAENAVNHPEQWTKKQFERLGKVGKTAQDYLLELPRAGLVQDENEGHE